MFGLWRQQLILSLYHRFGCQPVPSGMSCRENSGAYNAGIVSSKHMQKLLTKKGAKTKRKWYQPHIAEPQDLSGRRERPNKQGVSEAQGHRARQLSHVLYAKICQIANSGELDEEILNKQVLFTKVKMHPTFCGINVYWDANRADAAEIEPLLDGLSGKLRSLLISYHVLGRIPTITFVKNRSKGNLTQLNRLFELADYGPDYLPSTERDKEKSHFILGRDISALSSTHGQNTENYLYQDLSILSLEQESEKCSGNSLDTLSSEAGWQSECELPPTEVGLRNTSEELLSSFRSNLYGLPRDDLMKKVMAKKKKVKYDSTSAADSPVFPVSDSQLRDYRKLRCLTIKDKEKMLRQRDSTKMKQRLLEQEFGEVQDLLHEDFTDNEEYNNDIDNENQ